MAVQRPQAQTNDTLARVGRGVVRTANVVTTGVNIVSTIFVHIVLVVLAIAGINIAAGGQSWGLILTLVSVGIIVLWWTVGAETVANILYHLWWGGIAVAGIFATSAIGPQALILTAIGGGLLVLYWTTGWRIWIS